MKTRQPLFDPDSFGIPWVVWFKDISGWKVWMTFDTFERAETYRNRLIFHGIKENTVRIVHGSGVRP